MDIVNAASARAQYYDRSAEGFILGYGGSGVGPHGTTVRGSYTVPANRKTLVSSISMELFRESTTAANARYQARVKYTPFGGVASNLMLMKSYNRLINFVLFGSISPSFVMYPGDVISIDTIDESAAGTVDYQSYCILTEFSY